MKYRRFIKYGNLRSPVLYTGGIGQGKTLAAVIHIVKALKTKKYERVLSNIKLDVPQYEELTLERLLPDTSSPGAGMLTNSIVFIDNADISAWLYSRRSMSRINRLVTYFLMTQRRFGNLVILTALDIRNIDVRARRQATEIKCTYNEKAGLGLHKRDWGGNLDVYPIGGSQRYFKYFDTFGIPNMPFYKSEEVYAKEIEDFFKNMDIDVSDLGVDGQKKVGLIVEELTGKSFPRRI